MYSVFLMLQHRFRYKLHPKKVVFVEWRRVASASHQILTRRDCLYHWQIRWSYHRLPWPHWLWEGVSAALVANACLRVSRCEGARFFSNQIEKQRSIQWLPTTPTLFIQVLLSFCLYKCDFGWIPFAQRQKITYLREAKVLFFRCCQAVSWLAILLVAVQNTIAAISTRRISSTEQPCNRTNNIMIGQQDSYCE